MTHLNFSVPSSIKKPNQDKLKEILPLTEKLKMKLLERYKSEYTQFLANKEAERVREAEQAKEALKNKVSRENVHKSVKDFTSSHFSIRNQLMLHRRHIMILLVGHRQRLTLYRALRQIC